MARQLETRSMTPVLLEMRGITKRFPGVVALDGVDFAVRAGEVHALMGENGAGKSTLIKVLTGVHGTDDGEVVFEGQTVRPRTPREAEALGISTVYQEINLIPRLSVAENICLGRQPRRFGLLCWRAIRERADRALARLDLDLDVTRELGACSIAVQQMVAIARALDIETRLLVLDEPTSSLDRHEATELFDVMRRLRATGLGIVFITHFIDEVYEVSDRTTILRNGLRVGTFETNNLPRLELVRHMLGRAMSDRGATRATAVTAGSRRTGAGETTFIAARGLGRPGGVAPMDLEIGRGEVVGLAGLLGSGRTETARLLFGIDQPGSGEVRVDGERVRLRSPHDAIRLGFGFCPEDRKFEGLALTLSLRENVVLALQARLGVFHKLSRGEQRQITDRFIRMLDIRVSDPDAPIRNLSGGNQQKALVARWLATDPRFLILDEPTRGVDVGAKAEIEKLVGELRTGGMAVLFISSELDELVRNCSRVAVLRDRRKVRELTGNELDEHRIMQTIAESTRPRNQAPGEQGCGTSKNCTADSPGAGSSFGL